MAPERLAEDLAILRQAFLELHPGLERYATRAETLERFDALGKRWSTPRTRREAFLDLTEFTSTIRCGHTWPSFYNQGKTVEGELLLGQRRVPFLFRWIGREMIVTRWLVDDASLRPGASIEAINDRPAAELLDLMMPLTRADGTALAKRINQLEVQGVERWEAFDVYLSLLTPELFAPTGVTNDGAPAAPRLRLTIRDTAGSAPRTIDVSTLSIDERHARVGRVEPAKDAVLFDVAFEPTHATLRMPTWAVYNGTWDWKAYLEGVMDQLIERRIPTLIIDLRGNEGGLDCGDVILARCVTEPIVIDRTARWVRMQRTPEALRPYLDTWDNSFHDFTASALPERPGGSTPERREGFWHVPMPDGRAERVLEPKGPRYEGRLIVLIDASNSSATFQFANAVRQAKLGTLIGETTGGNRRGINGGAFFFLRLPNSRIEVDLPIYARFPPAEEGLLPDAGIEPDVFVRPTREAIEAGTDLVMEAAKARVRS